MDGLLPVEQVVPPQASGAGSATVPRSIFRLFGARALVAISYGTSQASPGAPRSNHVYGNPLWSIIFVEQSGLRFLGTDPNSLVSPSGASGSANRVYTPLMGTLDKFQLIMT